MASWEEITDQVLSTDVLVIGGGIAGCLAAIRAREAGLEVTLVDKANLGRSGLSHQMNGVLTYFEPGKDDPNLCYREGVLASEWLADQHRLQGMIEETTGRIRELEEWGVKFQKEDGEFVRKPGLGHQYLRNVVMTFGGFQLMSVMRGEVLRRGIRVVERVMVTDLLTADGLAQGTVTGAVGFGIRAGKFYVFKAKVTVMAAGASQNLLSPVPTPSLTDDGKAMALRAGAEMRNLELSMIGPNATHFGVLGANILLGEGAILVNGRGERFMPKWDSVRQERAPRSVMGRAIATEEQSGRGPVYLDATHLDAAAHRRIEMAIPEVIGVLAKGGVSLRRDKVEWTTSISFLGPGGIRVDRQGKTTVPGLYGAGACTDHGEDGAINVISHGMESAIGGDRVGKGAAGYASQASPPKVDKQQIQFLKSQIFAPLQCQQGLEYRQVRQMGNALWGLVGPVRNKAGLSHAIALVQDIRQETLPHLVAKDYHELAKVIGLGNELLLLEALARCALHRRESRGSHYREDFPKRDDAHWLRWVIVTKADNEMRVDDQAIPFETYPLKPDR